MAGSNQGVRHCGGGRRRLCGFACSPRRHVRPLPFRPESPAVPAANGGRVPALISPELTAPRSGAPDADLLAQHPFYGPDFTKPLLFMEDGSYFSNLANAQGLTGAQWGVMN